MLIIVGICVIIGIMLLYGRIIFIRAVCRNNKPIDEDESITSKTEKEWFKANGKEVEEKSLDGLRLKGYEFKHSIETHVWIILIHGYRIDAQSAICPKFFYDKGWNVLCPDLRGHGKSEGKYIGMGWLDRKDVLLWINRIIHQDHQAKIVLYGGSMGGATVMMTSGEKLPEQVVCGIEDSGFTTVWDTYVHNMKNDLHIPVFPGLHLAHLICRVVVGYDFKKASALAQLQKSKLPMLFIHGTEDKMIPYHMMETLFDAAQGEKQKLKVEGAGHVMSYRKQPELYWKTVYHFIEEHI